MPQQQRTINDLITQALYQTGEYAVGEDIDGYAIQTGLNLANEWLDDLARAGANIPYLSTVSFDMVIGQESYSVSDITNADVDSDRIVDLVYATYTLSESLEYPIQIVDRSSYYNNFRITTTQSRPNIVFLENQVQESLIKFYPKPDQAYPITLKVKQMIDRFELNDVIDEIPDFFHKFLRYSLVREFVRFFPSTNWSEQEEFDYQEMRNGVLANEPDLVIQPSCLLERTLALPYPSILSLP
jgi:hypothetical protein